MRQLFGYIKNEKNKGLFLLLIIVLIATILRFYKLDQVPPSISWDEAAVGYNAWTIANYGVDEYGKAYPIYFRSFGEGKNPIDIYITSIFVKFLGLNEVSIRLPAALLGVLNTLLIYKLANQLFKKEYIGLFSAFFFAISPFNIHFSHFNHEANFALFFFLLGLILFQLSIKKKKGMLFLSTLSFILCFLSYNASKVIVPCFLLLLYGLYIKEIIKYRIQLILSLLLLASFILVVLYNTTILGGERANQTLQGKTEVKKTKLFKLTGNEWVGRFELILTQYSWHFSRQFLFISGDNNPRLSAQVTGEFYKIDAIFLIIGFVSLLYKRSKEGFLLLGLVLLSPLPSSLAAEAPHAGRSMFMMGGWNLLSAVGLYSIQSFLNKEILKKAITIISILILTFFLSSFIRYYYGEYSRRYAIEWQYGYKQIVEFTQIHPEYSQIYITDIRSQPYIFFLYYLKIPPHEYANEVLYNNSETKSYNNVASFDRFYFGTWDPIESYPNKGVLYVVSPSQYDGLRYKHSFDIKKIINYPNGADAFYLISAK